MAEVKEKTGNMYYKGTWRYCADYQPGDVVVHGGDMYIALEQSAGMYPDDPLNSKYWRLMFANIGPAVTEHNALSGIQGGDPDRSEFYHVSKNEREAAAMSSAPSVSNPFVTMSDVPYLDKRVTDFTLADRPDGIGTLYAVTHFTDRNGEHHFVAVGDGCACVSHDGVKWTAVESEVISGGDWRGIAYGGGVLSAVGLRGSGAYSKDGGLTWHEMTVPEGDWNDIAFGNGVFIAVCNGRAMHSLDGISLWTARDIAPDIAENIAFGNGVFTIAGPGGIITTTDGIRYDERSSPSATWRGAAYGGGRFAVIGGKCMTSANGVNWNVTPAALPAGGWDSLTFGDGFFVGVGSSANVIVSESPDMRTPVVFELKNAPNYVWRDVCFGMDRFVAVGGGIMTAFVVDVAAALAAANMPNASNPFVTMVDLDEAKEEIAEKIDDVISDLDEVREKAEGLTEAVEHGLVWEMIV